MLLRVPAPVIRAGKAQQAVRAPSAAERVTGHERLPDRLEDGRILLPGKSNIVYLPSPVPFDTSPVPDSEGRPGLRKWVGRIRGEVVTARFKDHVFDLLGVQVAVRSDDEAAARQGEEAHLVHPQPVTHVVDD